MPLFLLSDEIVFPQPEWSMEDGLLAMGGDLSVDRLILAYQMGIFPWYSSGDILWWSPDPRLVLYPESFHISRSLMKTIKSGRFTVTFDRQFPEVIRACAVIPRHHQPGTWITKDMTAAYRRLHDAGYAHSVEVWEKDQLVGGLYGVSLGRCFFGESMFSRKSDASKVGLAALVERMRAWSFHLIDCQVATDHLIRLGAEEIPRKQFLAELETALTSVTRIGDWGEMV